MKITWLGHSCFRIESKGYSIITDPYEDGYVPGLMPPSETADYCFCSHDHGDHNAADLITIRKNASSNPFSFKFIDSFHDHHEGAKRGPNRMLIADDGEMKLCHFGDIGCHPTKAQTEQLKGLDIALIPVGGFYTMPPEETAEFVKEIAPRYIIPMHFRDDAAGFGFDVIAEVSEFLKYMPEAVCAGTDTIELTPDCGQKSGVIVLKPRLLAK